MVADGVTGSIVASMDIKALYPSIDQRVSATDLAKDFLRLDINVKDVNYRAATVYLAINCDRPELDRAGVLRTIPTRLHKRGTTPTVRTKELVGPIPHEKRWVPKNVTDNAPHSDKAHGIEHDPTETKYRQAPEPNKEEKRKIIGTRSSGQKCLRKPYLQIWRTVLQSDSRRTNWAMINWSCSAISHGQMVENICTTTRADGHNTGGVPEIHGRHQPRYEANPERDDVGSGQQAKMERTADGHPRKT